MSSAMEAKRRRLDSGSTDTTEPLSQQHDGYSSSDGENLSSQESEDEGEQEIYEVWLRHDGEEWIVEIPPGVDTKKMTLSEIVSIRENRSITHMFLERCNIPEDLHKVAPDLQQLRLDKIADIELQFDRIVELRNLKLLDINSCRFTSGRLPKSFHTMTMLTNLRFWDCGLTALDAEFANLKKLEKLSLGGNNFSELPEAIYELVNLVEFKPYDCGLMTLDSRLTNLGKLEKLNIGENKFKDGLLPPVVYEMLSLKNFYMRNCGVKELADDLSKLINLEVLDFSSNPVNMVPPAVHRLTKLKSLYMYTCGLTALDDRLSELPQITELMISDNQFQTLPNVVYELRGLRELRLMDCSLETIDDKLSRLENLEKLQLGNSYKKGFENRFKKLPTAITFLTNLQELDLRNLSELQSLNPRILDLSKLEVLDCDRCENLHAPPYDICKEGLEAVRKYYEDSKISIGQHMPTISAAVIGEKMAGKTSLIWSLKKRLRTLTHRNIDSYKDDTTIAFKVEEINMANYPLRVFDFGGHRVYHMAYQLTIRKNYIPIVVVNMEQFNGLVADVGTKEASRLLCMNYMSHLYLSCPKLGAPILVLTHSDRVKKTFDNLQEQLLSALDSLKNEMLEEERKLSGNKLVKIDHFKSELPLFDKKDIFVLSNQDDLEVLQRLKLRLNERCDLHKFIIPTLWIEMGVYFDGCQHLPYLKLTEIDEKYPGDPKHHILRYMHNIGRVLWFERNETLKEYVFHRISVITSIITELYHHHAQKRWDEKIRDVAPYVYLNRTISREKYRQLVEKFFSSGILDAALLTSLYDNRNGRFPFQHASTTDFHYCIALSLLQTFYLICGPIRTEPRETYILPYFSSECIAITAPQPGQIRLSFIIQFAVLPPPPYVYDLLTIVYLNLYREPTNRLIAARNGAQVKHKTTVSRLVHDSKQQMIHLCMDTDVDNLDRSWKRVIEIVDELMHKLLDVFVAARPICKFICPHCILIGQKPEAIDIDPDWYVLPSPIEHRIRTPLDQRLTAYTGVDPVPCQYDAITDGPLTVPSPLRFPCVSLSTPEKATVRDYVRNIQQLGRTIESPGISRAIAHPAESEDEDIDKFDQHVPEVVTLMVSEAEESINLPLETQLSSNYQGDIYEMSEIRGRALLISNKAEYKDGRGKSKWRRGSDHDHRNMERVLEKLRFVTAGAHKNYTAKDIVTAIHEETQRLDNDGESIYKRLGMFILMISSHGAKGCITGSDNIQVELTDIYDLLSPTNFPAMRGKPKVIIIQACAGEKQMRSSLLENTSNDHNNSDVTVPNETVYTGWDDTQSRPGASTDTSLHNDDSDDVDGEYDIDGGTEDFRIADFLIMKSAFDSFVAPRNRVKGSDFIRGLVISLFKFAHKYDMAKLAELVRLSVSRYSSEKYNERLGLGKSPEKLQMCQIPVSISTLTKKLYLKPGVIIRRTGCTPTQPINGSAYTKLLWKDELRIEESQGALTRRYRRVKWSVVRSGNDGVQQSSAN